MHSVSSAVAGALRPLGDGYRELFDRTHAVAVADPRIRGFWLSGSLGTGTADAGSDLDLIVTVCDEDFDRWTADWHDWLTSVTDTVLARELPFAPGCFTALTVDCLRLDVISERASEVATSGHRRRVVVFDRDALQSAVPDPDPPREPDVARIADLVGEAYRMIAIFPQAVLARRDWLLGVTGIHRQREMLYELYVETNQPLPPGGVKQYAAKLSTAQYGVLCSLPAVEPTSESVCAGMRATVGAWNTHGRGAAEVAGVSWPERLAETVTAYFEQHVG